MILYPNKQTVVTNSTTSVVLNLASDVATYYFSGTATLSGNLVVSTTGTAKEGMVCLVVFNTALTLGAYSVTVLGEVIVDDIASDTFYTICTYNDSAWHVLYGKIVPFGTGGGTIGIDGNGDLEVTAASLDTSHLEALAAIKLTQLADGTANTLIGHNGSGVPIELPLATYPSLTELSYVKGLSSAVQTQITARPASGAIVNADINASAAIDYTKLHLANHILNADINTGAAIDYSKLDLVGHLVDADIDAAAAITHSKMAALTASRVMGTDGSGVASALTTGTYPSLAELAYLKGTTSAVQTQLTALSAAITAVAPSKVSSAVLNTGTVLVAATLKTDYECDCTVGGFTVTLPAANTVAADTMVKFWLLGAANNLVVQRAGADSIVGLNLGLAINVTMTALGNWVFLVCNGSNAWKIYSDKLT
jgi:hypothetical protein